LFSQCYRILKKNLLFKLFGYINIKNKILKINKYYFKIFINKQHFKKKKKLLLKTKHRLNMLFSVVNEMKITKTS